MNKNNYKIIECLEIEQYTSKYTMDEGSHKNGKILCNLK